MLLQGTDNAPTLGGDAYTAHSGQALSVDAAHGVLANDTAAGGYTLAVAGAELVSGQGQLSVNPDGSFTFTPDAGFSGKAVIRYLATDGRSHSADQNTKVTKLGSEFLVNTIPDYIQNYPNVVTLADGGFVITFQDQSGKLGDVSRQGIAAQRFAADGTKIGDEFRVNTFTSQYQQGPVGTALADGRFVIAWEDYSGALGDNSEAGVTAQIYNADGTPFGSEFLVNTQTFSYQLEPAIAALANGDFVITWTDLMRPSDGSDASVKGRIYSATGVPRGDEFIVNSATNGLQVGTSVSALADGRFVVTWYDKSGAFDDQSDFAVTAQIFDATGTKSGAEFQVNSQTFRMQVSPSITALTNGGFVVTWLDYSGTLGDASGTSIKAQVYGADGAKVGGEFLVNTFTSGNQNDPRVTGLANGGFVVTWWNSLGAPGDVSGYSVAAQVFDAAGNKIGTEFIPATNTTSDQLRVSVSALPNGDFVVSWEDRSGTLGDSDNSSIKAQIYHVEDLTAGYATVTVENDAPVAVADSYRTNSGGLSVDAAHGLLANDQDTENNPLKVTGASLVSGQGQLTWNDDGSFTFTPDAGFTGDAVVKYTVSDGEIHTANQDTVIEKVGSEFVVNSIVLNNQVKPSIASLADGGYLVTWQDESLLLENSASQGIAAQRYGADGQKVGNEFRVETNTAGEQSSPKATGLVGGGFVITWVDKSGTLGDASGASVKAQVFKSDGTRSGGEFLVNTHTADNQTEPTITALSDGGFVITWSDMDPRLVTTDVKGQVFDASGTRRGGEFTVNTYTQFYQYHPSIASLANGGFVIGWDNVVYTGPTTDYFKGQIFDASGNRQGGEFALGSSALSQNIFSSLTGLANGGFVATWQDAGGAAGDASGFGIHAQLFDAIGNKVGAEFVVNTSIASDQVSPAVTTLPNGGFVVVWQDSSRTLGDDEGTSIKAQAFDASGARIGTEFLVNTVGYNNQILPTITSLANGDFVISWEDDSVPPPIIDGPDLPASDGSGTSIKAQIFHVSDRSTGYATIKVGNSDPVLTGAQAVLDHGQEDTSYTFTKAQLLQGFTDADIGDVLSITSVVSSSGQVFDNGNGTYRLSPGANVFGNVLLNYIVSDGQGGSAAGQLTVVLDPVNDDPALTGTQAVLAHGTEDHDVTVTKIQLLQGFADADPADVLSVSGLSATHASVIDNLDGTYTIRPDADYNGDVALSYTVEDGNGGSVAGSMTLVVDSINDDPVLTGAKAVLDHGQEDTSYTFTKAQLLQGFTDADIGDVLSITSVISSSGQVFDNGDGTYRLSPGANVFGNVLLNYIVSDGQGGSAAGQLTVVLDPVNDDPALTGTQAVLAHGTEDHDVTVTKTQLLQGFADADPADVLSVSGLSATHASVIDNHDGTYTIRPDADYNGNVALSYTVEDGNGGSAPGNLTLVIDPVDDAPVVTGESYDVAANRLLVVDVARGLLANDRDIDSASLTVKSASISNSPVTLVLNRNGAFSFLSLPGFDGDVTIDYVVTDGTNDVHGLATIHVSAKPTDIVLANDHVLENSAAGTVVGTLVTTDPDDATGFTYTLLKDDAKAFVIDGAVLKVRPGAVIDFETTPSLDITVRVKDPAGHTFDKVLAITVDDLSPMIIGTSAADKLKGTAENDRIYGREGGDTLYGYDLSDQIFGEGGADLLYGGNGNDSLDGGAGNDRLYGEAGNDTLYGGADNDTLDGGTGADAMYGGTGNDTYFVDNADDSVHENGNEGTDLVNAGISYALGDNVENLTLTGTGNIDGTGNDLANTIIGNAGNNVLSGGGGADKLRGGSGNDTLYGGADNDSLDGGTGADLMAGGAGNDTYVVDDAGDRVTEEANAGTDLVNSSVSFTLGENIENLTLTGTGNIDGTGNGGANTIVGNAGNNLLSGGAGADKLSGGAGNDTLVGGTGNDSLTGGAGADTFVIALDGSLDTLVDFTPTLGDTIRFDRASFGIAAGTPVGEYVKLVAPTDNRHGYIVVLASGLYWDADGSGSTAAVKIASFQTQPVGVTIANFSLS